MSYVIKPADITADKALVVGVCARSGLQLSPSKYDWNYYGNPLGAATCWLARQPATDEVVGAASLFPRTLLVDGRRCRAAVAGDFAVARRHRLLGVAAQLQKLATSACARGDLDVVFGFADEHPAAVMMHSGYIPLGNFEVAVRVLSTSYAIAKLGMPSALARIGPALDRLFHWAVDRDGRSRPDLRFEMQTRFDESFEPLWQKALRHYRVATERSCEYLNWRFGSSPHKQYSILVASGRQGGTRLGYLTFWSDGAKVHIVDLLAKDNRVLNSLLTAFITHQRQSGTACISMVYLGGPALRGSLAPLGFWFRRTSGRVLICVNPAFPAADVLLDKNNWYLLEGDSDS